MSVKLLTEHHLEFLSLHGGCACSSESTLVKMPHCWKSHVAAHLTFDTQVGGAKLNRPGSLPPSLLPSVITCCFFTACDPKAARDRQDSITKTNTINN